MSQIISSDIKNQLPLNDLPSMVAAVNTDSITDKLLQNMFCRSDDIEKIIKRNILMQKVLSREFIVDTDASFNTIVAVLSQLVVTFIGKEAHASICPWEGINALDAAVLAYQSISCLRQQMPVDNRIHGIISKGGDAPNIIPNFTEMQYYVRAPNAKLLKEFLLRVYECFNGAAKLTKCEVNIRESCPLYEEILSNKTLLNIFEQNASALGISFETVSNNFRGSSDVGNVSHSCPTIQPMFSIGCSSELHTKEFATDAGTITAQKCGIIQGKAMAGTLIDIAMDKDYNLLKCIKQDFHNQISTAS